MGQTLGFISIKGGVGKTTLSLETASSLANKFGKKVLVLDGNFSAPNLDLYLGLEHNLTLHDILKENSGYGIHKAIYEKYGFDIVPASLFPESDIDIFQLKRSLDRIKNRYDFIILDSSPNYKEMIPVVAASSSLFVVSTPDYPTLTTSLKSAQIAKQKNTPIHGIILNKMRNPWHELGLKDVEELSGIPVVARIPDHKIMAEALHYQKPLTLHSPNHPISQEISRFAGALSGVPEKIGFLHKFFHPLSSFVKTEFEKEKVNRELLRQQFYTSQFS